jgi:hypothetical protein
MKRPELTSGTDALRAADEQLRATRSRWDEVRKVTDELEKHRERNHFIDSIRTIMGGGGG